MKVVLDKTKADDGKQGEIIVSGPNIMVGYHNPTENKGVFTVDGGFRTGDLGVLDDDGFLYITGRIKEQYKLENGKYVAPLPSKSSSSSPLRHQRHGLRRQPQASTWRSSSPTWTP